MKRYNIIIACLSLFVIALSVALLSLQIKKTMVDRDIVEIQKINVQHYSEPIKQYAYIAEHYVNNEEKRLNSTINSFLDLSESVETEIYKNNLTDEEIKKLTDVSIKCASLLKMSDLVKSKYYRLLHSLNNNLDEKVKLNRLYLVTNDICQYYLENILSNSITLSKAKLISIPENDTIKLGETFHTQLYFTSSDLRNNTDYYEVFSDASLSPLKLNNSIFEECPTSKGAHHHNIMLCYYGLYKMNCWQTNVDYFVK